MSLRFYSSSLFFFTFYVPVDTTPLHRYIEKWITIHRLRGILHRHRHHPGLHSILQVKEGFFLLWSWRKQKSFHHIYGFSLLCWKYFNFFNYITSYHHVVGSIVVITWHLTKEISIFDYTLLISNSTGCNVRKKEYVFECFETWSLIIYIFYSFYLFIIWVDVYLLITKLSE